MATEWPDPCPKCGAEAKLRKLCERCEEGVYVIAHSEHYMGGAHEVVECRCGSRRAKWSKENQTRVRAKKQARITRETGKVFHPEKNRPITTPEMARKAAEGLCRGLSIRQALLEAGFPKTKANGGRPAINKMIRVELKSMNRKYIQIGRDLSPEDQENMVRGRLAENVLIGTDKGVMSAKQLGADKRIAMWQPDSQVGMVVLSPPPLPKIDHEVKWVESKGAAMLRARSQEEGPEHEETPAEPEQEIPSEEEVWEEEEKKHAS